MAISKNRIWEISAGANGDTLADTFTLKDEPIPQPRSGELLARARFISVDPYMLNSLARSDGLGAKLDGNDGLRMPSGAVAEVIESHDLATPRGSLVHTDRFGWQEYAVLKASNCGRVDESVAPAEAWLSYLGTPGLTAWLALDTIGKVKKGETVVVSAASGAVGQLAGQLVKAYGGRAVAVAGSDEKLQWCEQIGFDATVNYKTCEDLPSAIAATCPKGVDVFFDNTGGYVHDAVMRHLNACARVIVCGLVSHVDRLDQADIGERFLRKILLNRIEVKGFWLDDHISRFEEARKSIINIASDDQFDYLFDVMDGINALPDALMRLKHGMNVGKQLVKL